ncbi:DUF2290 domain-containing protein [Nocardioides alkalitolerans]|uniref:DUF2290 domain-containing protein n=1 Tax=Nocardioides alkalitolerans TaxID=281714 RepID=UPI0012FB694B|nr:DUF2290 domain-containing protein [Nocardioides alkalitolerans]
MIDLYSAELNEATRFLLARGLLSSYNTAHKQNPRHGVRELVASYWRADPPKMVGSVPHAELHRELTARNSFDLRFLDGALMTFKYEFSASGKGQLRRSAVSFLPSPDLTVFQEDPELYLGDALFGDVVDEGAVTVPLRFDYDAREAVVEELRHPVSHLTIGSYKHCRIPLTCGASPYYVIEFVLRAFYQTPTLAWSSDLPGPRTEPPVATISDLERTLIHVALPTA